MKKKKMEKEMRVPAPAEDPQCVLEIEKASVYLLDKAEATQAEM